VTGSDPAKGYARPVIDASEQDDPEHDASPGGASGCAGSTAAGVWVGQGARRVEARLIAEVSAWHEAMRADPVLLAHPLRVLVPSRSLKDHVSAVLVRELDSLAGVAVQTHWGLALQILERAGLRAPAGAELVPVLVRQAAREVPVLRRELDDLDDGYGCVAAAVSDLLDAGLDEATAEPLLEQLDEIGGRVGERAAAVVGVARAVHQALREHGLGRLADVLVQAREAFEADPSHLAPGRLVIHGFADATGLVADFLAALVRAGEVRVLLDRVPDPTNPAEPDLGAGFIEPLERVLAAASGGTPERDTAVPPERALACFRAPGSDAEVRAVARRVESRLAAGARPEAIGVVTRTPALYAPALRVQLARLGIPASGAGTPGPRSLLGRRIAFLLDLLGQREQLPADRFVLSLRDLHPGERADLRIGVHALGLPRLAELAAPGAEAAFGDADFFPLPVRRGLASGEGAAQEGDDDLRADDDRREDEAASGDDEAANAEAAPRGADAAPGHGAPAGPHAQRRRLGRALLVGAATRARDTLTVLASAGAPRPLAAQLAAVESLAAGPLGWSRDGEAAPLYARLATLRAELPPSFPLNLDELVLLLERALGSLTHEPLGGAGGGVQLLDVTEARARTFDHLFVLGMNRDHFPRVVAEDPLLPDEVRVRIQAVLPELAAKERGHEEERFLFAELVSASPDVTISWQILGDDGKAKAPSPLVDRLLSPLDTTERVATLLAPPGPGPRPAHEWALLAALHGGDAAGLLPAALAEARGRAGAVGEPDLRLAALRAAAAAELDAVGHEGDGADDADLGPFLGQVGPAREAADLRRGDLWVTTLEKIARCPWQGFLSRMLRLERPPDALEALPAADGLIVGSLVHDVLEQIVRDVVPKATPGKRAELSERLPRPVPWPDDARLEGLLRERAGELLFRNGIGLPGFASVLIEVARPYLEMARRLDWATGPVAVVDAEVTHFVDVATGAGPLRLHFRADRVDRVEGVDRSDGGLLLTDYKTGQPIKDARREDTRFDALRREIRRGRALQAPAYARVAPGARGRYAYLGPEISDDSRNFIVAGGEELDEAFGEAVAELGDALAVGVFPPRLVDAAGEEPPACQWCELAIACLRGDSGVRRRLGAWAAARASSSEAAADERDVRRRALRAVYALGDAS